MSIEYVLICDGCSSVIHAEKSSAAETRRNAKEQCGAKVSRGSQGEDLCHSCIEYQAVHGAPPIAAQRRIIL